MIFANEISEQIPATVAMFEKKKHGLSAAFLGPKNWWNLQNPHFLPARLKPAKDVGVG